MLNNCTEMNTSRRSARGRSLNVHRTVKKTKFKFVPNTEFERNRAIKASRLTKHTIKPAVVQGTASTSTFCGNRQHTKKKISGVITRGQKKET